MIQYTCDLIPLLNTIGFITQPSYDIENGTITNLSKGFLTVEIQYKQEVTTVTVFLEIGSESQIIKAESVGDIMALDRMLNY